MTSFFTSQKILFTTRSHLIPEKTLPIQNNWLNLSGESCQTKIYDEYLTLRSIHGSRKGTDIFRELQVTVCGTQLDPSKLFAVATDGCPSMLGANQGLINKWRRENDLAPVT